MGGALLAISAPVYWLGLVALYLFANDIGVVHVFDGAGHATRASRQNPARWFGSLILPWMVLAASFAAFYARLLRANLIETMSEDYIRTARAKGLPERRVIGRHAMRAAITPDRHRSSASTSASCSAAPSSPRPSSTSPASAGSPTRASSNADLPVIQGTVLFGAFFIVVANLDRRHRLRLPRPAGAVLVTWPLLEVTDLRGPLHAPRTASSRPSTASPTRWTAARRSASWASRGRARASPSLTVMGLTRFAATRRSRARSSSTARTC